MAQNLALVREPSGKIVAIGSDAVQIDFFTNENKAVCVKWSWSKIIELYNKNIRNKKIKILTVKI
jgi:hypothetical protein